MKDNTIICPKCKTGIDFSGYADFVKEEFYKEVNKIVIKHNKNENKNNKTNN